MTASPTIEPVDVTHRPDRDQRPGELVGDWREKDPLSFAEWVSRLSALLHHHRPSQFLQRAMKLVRGRYRQLRPLSDDAYTPQSVPAVRQNAGLNQLAARKLTQRALRANGNSADLFAASRFRLLNRDVELVPPVDWRLTSRPELPHLWRFQFHYHEYLLDVAAGEANENQPEQVERIWRFIVDWIDGNRLGDPRVHQDAWHAFCIARRLPVWVTLWTSCPPSSGKVADAIVRSIAQQAQFLSDHLEWDLGGNHLLEDLRALAVTGGFLEGPVSSRLLGCVARNLARELKTQILEHGEHFERSPMYHALMLDALLDIRDATGPLDPELSARAGRAADRMGEFLVQMLDPGGAIPLLGDSVYGEAPPIETLVHNPADESRRAGARRVGSYWIWNDGRGRLLFDAGAVGADDLPAHAHCDLLNLQMSVDGQPLIVDSGVYGYDDDEMRRYCRSTAAHNVVQVDGLDQCDMWSRFRMGRRGHPSELQMGELQGFSWATATHDAYCRIGAVVRRWIACRPEGPWLVVDGVTGRGRHRVTNRLHFHPGVELVLGKAGAEFSVGEVRGTVQALGPGEVALKTGWYCPEFGRRESSTVLEFETRSECPLVFGWFVSLEEDQRDAELVAGGSGRWMLRYRTAGETHELPVEM